MAKQNQFQNEFEAEVRRLRDTKMYENTIAIYSEISRNSPKFRDEANYNMAYQLKINRENVLSLGFGCDQNITMAQKLLQDSSGLGFRPATIWINSHQKEIDFGASEAIKKNMI
ncbi:2053_t:CDS:2 [Racocetra persica]|uniref:2053_t:CDS:1 n=1 Tax=Racocetra persica TaxID=160502 RepID=A0ACA9K7Y7_9GLOM|nr:2053_t:CDS:2 [Racocetra persica]